MKLHLANPDGIKLFSAHGPGYVAVNHERHENNLIVLPDRIITTWTTATVASLGADEVACLLALQTGIILLGTGQRLRFPSAQWLAPFSSAGIGIEIMDLPAACRTYNILASEGRLVAAALLFD